MISFQETRTLVILWPPAALQLGGNRSGGSADTFGQARPCSVRFGYPGRQCGAADNSTTSSQDSSFTAGFCFPLSVFRLLSSSNFEFCGQLLCFFYKSATREYSGSCFVSRYYLVGQDSVQDSKFNESIMIVKELLFIRRKNKRKLCFNFTIKRIINKFFS